MSQFGIDWFRESLKNHSDTFSSAPNLFSVLYNFWTKNDTILQCAYCCMPDKTAASYAEMLTSIQNIVKPLGDLVNLPYLPALSLTDFEQFFI